jgi:hypothetical protein
MKCIHCGTNANYKTRQPSGRCPNCHHKYAFEPKNQPNKLTDLFFQKAIDRVSYEGQLYFTKRQLWHEINRGLARRRRIQKLIGPTLLGTFIALILYASFESLLLLTIPFWVFVATIAWNYYAKHYTQLWPSMPYDLFMDSVLPRWLEVQGKPNWLLANQDFQINPRGEEADLTDYGFERMVITENRETATMLLTNKLHLEKKCAILCAMNLSSNQSKLILKMTENCSQLKVMVVHDASIEGCDLSNRIQQEPWFREDDFELIDLGLMPEQVKELRLFTLIEPVPEHGALTFQGKHLSEKEINWLKQGYSAELEGLRPRHLLHSIAQGFAFADKTNLDEEEAYSEGIYWFETFG